MSIASPDCLRELEAWDSASSEVRLASARAVAETLPSGWGLAGLEPYALGGQRREVGLFSFEDARFALIPGSSAATLGYDRTQPYGASAGQLEDWQVVQEEYGHSLHEYLDHYLTPLRQVGIAPFLLEVSPRSFAYDQDGDDQTEGYEDLLVEIGAAFRLPTADEWEYACAAGTRSLFRWGDDCPIGNSCDEQRFTAHRQPNAFGLVMPSSSYHTEICQGPAIRGGDGGCAVCGGIGKVITWLPLASAFRIPDEEIAEWWMDDVFYRRVVPVAVPGSA